MKKRLKTLFMLHLVLILYSVGGIYGKKAAGVPFLCTEFCIYYGIVIVLTGVYAIAWQQIIKRLPLTTAYANKAVTMVWGIIWGAVFFHEKITPGKLLGAAIVIVGVVLYVRSDKQKEGHDV